MPSDPVKLGTIKDKFMLFGVVVVVVFALGAINVIALGVEIATGADSSLLSVDIPLPTDCTVTEYLVPGKNGLVITVPDV